MKIESSAEFLDYHSIAHSIILLTLVQIFTKHNIIDTHKHMHTHTHTKTHKYLFTSVHAHTRTHTKTHKSLSHTHHMQKINTFT